jgi:hypothetical protein
MSEIDAISMQLQQDYERLGTWRKVGEKYGSSSGLVFRMANGYEPKRVDIRLRFGLSVYASVPVCSVHGVVHIGACPKERRYSDWFSMPIKQVMQAIINREEITI